MNIGDEVEIIASHQHITSAATEHERRRLNRKIIPICIQIGFMWHAHMPEIECGFTNE